MCEGSVQQNPHQLQAVVDGGVCTFGQGTAQHESAVLSATALCAVAAALIRTCIVLLVLCIVEWPGLICGDSVQQNLLQAAATGSSCHF
jgi:hypothetical protein